MSKELRDSLVAQCQLSSLYHEHRESFLSFCHRSVLFVIIMSSALLASGYSSGFLNNYDWLVYTLTLLPVALASSDLVFNFSTASQTHRFFRHQFTILEAQLVDVKINSQCLHDISKEITRLMAEEPPAYRALLHHCTNLVDLRKKKKPTLKIPFWQMRFRNIFRLTGIQPQRMEGR
jgi:hypothetical protein